MIAAFWRRMKEKTRRMVLLVHGRVKALPGAPETMKQHRLQMDGLAVTTRYVHLQISSSFTHVSTERWRVFQPIR